MDILLDLYTTCARINCIKHESDGKKAYIFLPFHVPPTQARRQLFTISRYYIQRLCSDGKLFYPQFGKLHVTFITLTLTDPKMSLDLVLLKRNTLNFPLPFF